MKQGQSIVLQVNQCKNLDLKIQGFIKIKKNNAKSPSFLSSFKKFKGRPQLPERIQQKMPFKKSLTDWRSLYVSPRSVNRNHQSLSKHLCKQAKAQTQFQFFPSKVNQEKQIQSRTGKLDNKKRTIKEFESIFSTGDNLKGLISRRAISTQLANSRVKRLKQKNQAFLIEKIKKNIQKQNAYQGNSIQLKQHQNPQDFYQLKGLAAGKTQNKKFRATHKIKRGKSWATDIVNDKACVFNHTVRVSPTKSIIEANQQKDRDRRIMFNQEISWFKLYKRENNGRNSKQNFNSKFV